jgi:hypothetical protein
VVVADEAPAEVAGAPPASPSAGTLKAASAFKRLVGAKGASSDAEPAPATAAAVASSAEESATATSPASVTLSPDSLAGKAVLAFRGKNSRQGSLSMKEYAFPDTKETYAPLPKGFTGAENLQLPNYLRTRNSGVTLPSRLEVLGNNEYKIASTLSAASIGNAVVVRFHAQTYSNIRPPYLTFSCNFHSSCTRAFTMMPKRGAIDFAAPRRPSSNSARAACARRRRVPSSSSLCFRTFFPRPWRACRFLSSPWSLLFLSSRS